MNSPLISFILVTYNSADTIEACLASIEAHTAHSYEVVVVDNSPGEETALAVRRFMEARPDGPFRLDESGENLGFAKGCNRGARQSSGKYLFFLNPDTVLLNDASVEMLRCLSENPKAGAVGPALFDQDGQVTPTCRHLPTCGRMLLDASGLDRWIGRYRMTRFSHREPRRVEQIMGAAMLLPRSRYWALQGMDERFFIYYEEVDLCKRLAQAGGEVWFWPAARVCHLAGQSTESTPVRAQMIYVLRESRMKYFRKHFGASGAMAMDLINRLEGFAKWMVLSVSGAVRGRVGDREKARGFLSVATRSVPQD